jgi:hypothetical protein
MAKHRKKGELSDEERSVVKRLVVKGWRDQDILQLLNTGRTKTTSLRRISEVKKDDEIYPAADSVVDYFLHVRNQYDPHTGLNPYWDERVVRGREAMMLAVQHFNSPNIRFKTGFFAFLQILPVHAFFERKGRAILKENGQTVALSDMLEWEGCPLSEGARSNLKALKEIRDLTEHHCVGPADERWASLFQACCLNFENNLTAIWGTSITSVRIVSGPPVCKT